MKSRSKFCRPWIVAFAFAGALSAASEASELSLARVGGVDLPLKVREILVNEDADPRTLETSSKRGAPSATLEEFAVMIELVGGDRGAREKFEVLRGSDFTLKPTKYFDGKPVAFEFIDLRDGETYDCGLNREVRENPAVSRSN